MPTGYSLGVSKRASSFPLHVILKLSNYSVKDATDMPGKDGSISFGVNVFIWCDVVVSHYGLSNSF